MFSRTCQVLISQLGGVGKSCLTGQCELYPNAAFWDARTNAYPTAQFVHNEWIESYDPTIEDSYRTQFQVDVSVSEVVYCSTSSNLCE